MNVNKKSTVPNGLIQRTTRPDAPRNSMSLPAGKCVPVAYFPLLREDQMQGKFRLSFEMAETSELLMNAVNVRVQAWFVPKLALPRFQRSLDILNKSMAGEPAVQGGAVVPYFETVAFGAPGANEIFEYLGLHGKAATLVNTDIIESYNLIFNHRATLRSKDIAHRLMTATALADAFWADQRFSHVLPSFDAAIQEGEVALTVANARMPVTGLGLAGAATPATNLTLNKQADGSTVTFPKGWAAASIQEAPAAGQTFLRVREKADQVGFPDIYAELAQDGITVSLANLDLARNVQTWARIREQYVGIKDEWIIDQLMKGIPVGMLDVTDPILLPGADKMTVFGYGTRHSTTSGNLDEKVVEGATFVELPINVPRTNTGGIVMVTVEITPEQLWERQKDHFLHATTVADLPDAERDFLRPQKVSIVQNDDIDIDHDTPTDTFGYAPMNWEWVRGRVNIGGRAYRPLVDAPWSEVRQRYWTPDVVNPTLAENFYLCKNLPTDVFVVTDQDPFDVVMTGAASISGLTQFGPALIEDNGSYDAVMENVPTERIDQEA